MLAILLTVLKIIGIVLLCLLVTILVVAGLILFVPIQYKASGFYRDGYAVYGHASWLLHFISAKVSIQTDTDLRMVVRILGIPVYDNQRKKKQKVKKTKVKNAKLQSTDDLFEDSKIVNPSVPHEQGEKTQQSILQEDSASEIELTVPEAVEEKVEEDLKFSVWDRLKFLFEKCIERVRNIRYTISRICDRIKKIKDNIKYYLDLFQEENTKLALEACKKELLRIWKDIKPKRFKVNVLLGMDDPGVTGQIIGYCAVLYPLHQGNIVVVPDFEEQRLEADFNLKGKLTVYVYLIVAYTVLFNKNIKQFKKCMLREDS